jgi:DNA-directed RNA polymerase subunit L
MTGSDLTLSLDGKNMEFARDILKEILESDNVEDTIYKYAHILNKNILTVIEAEKRQALLDKDNDLVDGLDGLSGYISQIIMRGNH